MFTMFRTLSCPSSSVCSDSSALATPRLRHLGLLSSPCHDLPSVLCPTFSACGWTLPSHLGPSKCSWHVHLLLPLPDRSKLFTICPFCQHLDQYSFFVNSVQFFQIKFHKSTTFAFGPMHLTSPFLKRGTDSFPEETQESRYLRSLDGALYLRLSTQRSVHPVHQSQHLIVTKVHH